MNNEIALMSTEVVFAFARIKRFEWPSMAGVSIQTFGLFRVFPRVHSIGILLEGGRGGRGLTLRIEEYPDSITSARESIRAS